MDTLHFKLHSKKLDTFSTSDLEIYSSLCLLEIDYYPYTPLHVKQGSF